jgi:hypothetical protein
MKAKYDATISTTANLRRNGFFKGVRLSMSRHAITDSGGRVVFAGSLQEVNEWLRSGCQLRMAITGKQVTKLMRISKVTVSQLSDRMGITQKRIREVRKDGLEHRGAGRDWIQAITGTDPGKLWKVSEVVTN